MDTRQKELVSYLIKNTFSVTDYKDLDRRISGMTANQIIEAMEEAKQLIEKLKSSSLGRELM